MIQAIKESDWFLTAKGKLIDNVEWHAFGTGIIASSFYYAPIKHSTEFSYLLVTAVASIALGVELYRVKKNGNLSRSSVEVASLKRQIKEEGQYALLGLVVPHALAVIHLILL